MVVRRPSGEDAPKTRPDREGNENYALNWYNKFIIIARSSVNYSRVLVEAEWKTKIKKIVKLRQSELRQNGMEEEEEEAEPTNENKCLSFTEDANCSPLGFHLWKRAMEIANK